MSITFDFENTPSCAVFHAVGEISFDQVCDSLAAFYRETESHPVANVLWDIRAADVSRLTSAEMERLPLFAGRFTHARKGGRTAIVAAREVDFAVTRLISFFSHNLPVTVRAFRNLEEAESWLQESR
ncbi:MAG TPA: STAS/SEC14 domain-containing protein [Desulfobacterales bacterium]